MWRQQSLHPAVNHLETPASPSTLLLVDLDGSLAGFDHGQLLPGEKTGYAVGSSSTNSPAASQDVALTSTRATSMSATRGGSQRQRNERKGHTKSRKGCFHCKKRRIKCQETRPACGHCEKTGLRCAYPATPQVTHQPKHQIPLFTLQDMRFFQHFLLSCCPQHPLGNESVWTHEIPCLSQNHEYLMHAILGLSASDLMTKEDPKLLTSAMTHRVKAINHIKKALGEISVTNTYETGNATMATCFALTFQSVLLDDGMAEFMTFCRGIVIVAIQMHCKGAKFLFSNFMGEEQIAQLKPLMETVPPIPSEWTDMAVHAIRSLRPLCVHLVELEYWKLLVDMAEALYTSPFLSYQILCKQYGWWMQMPHDHFQRIIDPSNSTCILLGSHWIATKQIMATVTEKEHLARSQGGKPKDGNVDEGMVRWLRYLNRQVLPQYQQYNQWPMWVESRLEEDITVFGKTLG